VHPDRRLVDLFGLDTPLDVVGVDMHGQRLADRVDGDIGVIDRTNIDPAVAAVYRATTATDRDLDALGGVDEVELIKITAITERVAVGPRRAGPRFGPLGDRVATLRTEAA